MVDGVKAVGKSKRQRPKFSQIVDIRDYVNTGLKWDQQCCCRYKPISMSLSNCTLLYTVQL